MLQSWLRLPGVHAQERAPRHLKETVSNVAVLIDACGQGDLKLSDPLTSSSWCRLAVTLICGQLSKATLICISCPEKFLC